MAVDKIIIEVSGNTQGVKPVIDDLEKLGIVDKKNAEQFRKNNLEFSEDNKKKIANIQALQKSVDLLQSAIEKSQNPQLTQSLNKALSEQNKRLQDAIRSAQNLELQFKVTEDASIRRNQEAKKAADQQIAKEQKLASDLETVTQKLIRLGVIEQKNAAEFTKNTGKFTIDSQRRIDKVLSIEKSIQQLQYALSKAENPAQVRALNIALAEQHRRLIDATAAAKKLDVAVEKVGTNTGFFKGQLNQLGAQIAGAFAVTQLISFGKEAVQLAAKGEGIRRAFAALNQADLLKNLQEATRNTVADIDLMAAAVKANNFKIPLEDLARYFKFAQQRARETGESVDYLVESIVLGIGRKSPLILDNLGISAVELRTKLKGIGTESATVGQISQAVGQIIDEELSKQGVLLDTTADKLARLEAGWKNFGETAGVAIIDVLDYLSDLDAAAGTSLGGLGDAIDAERKKIDENIAKAMNLSIDAIKRRTEAAKQLENASKKEIDTVGVLLERIKALQEEYKDVSTPEQYAAITAKIKTVQEQLEKIIGKTTDKIKEQKKELDKPTKIDDSLGGTLDVADYEARQKEIADLAQAGADEATRIKAEEVAERLRLDDILAENEKKNQEEVTANLEAEARRRQQIEQALQQAVSQLVTMAIDYQLSLSQKATDYELDLLQDRFDAKKITEEQYNSQRRAILKDQAQKQKEAAIIKATIDTANAVINAFSEGGPVLAAIAGAVGIAQLAIISATPIPEFEKGGRIGGKRHRDGGTPLIAEKDEFIINRKAASKIGFDNLEMLNRGIVPVKLLKQGISDSRDKKMENTLKAVFGSNDFDTYPIEKELRKNRKHDTELTHLLIKNLKQGSRKRGGYQ